MGRVAFKQADLERTIRALKAVGETIKGVETRPDGTVTVLTGAEPDPEPLSPLEAWRRENGHRAP